jgi:hypothetical protein
MSLRDRDTIDYLRASFCGASGDFHTTHWTLVYDAVTNPKALAQLVTEYRPALLAYLTRSMRLHREIAEDILQDFLTTKLLEKQILQDANAERGRFRNFLRRSLHNFACNALRNQRHEAGNGALPPEDPPSPGNPDPFDREWASRVIEMTLQLMKQECEADGRMDLWEIFEGRLLRPIFENEKPESYRQVTERYGLKTPTDAYNALVTAKRRFSRALEETVARYERYTPDVEEEIRDLFRSLADDRAS